MQQLNCWVTWQTVYCPCICQWLPFAWMCIWDADWRLYSPPGFEPSLPGNTSLLEIKQDVARAQVTHRETEWLWRSCICLISCQAPRDGGSLYAFKIAVMILISTGHQCCWSLTKYNHFIYIYLGVIVFITIGGNVIVQIQVLGAVEVTDRAAHGTKQINTAG